MSCRLWIIFQSLMAQQWWILPEVVSRPRLTQLEYIGSIYPFYVYDDNRPLSVYPFYVYDGNRPLAPILRQRRCSLMYDAY
jgi:hypothetical protein